MHRCALFKLWFYDEKGTYLTESTQTKIITKSGAPSILSPTTKKMGAGPQPPGSDAYSVDTALLPWGTL